jgi:hypothetical protein
MLQEQQALIKAYLSDETKLYQDWYKEISQAKHDQYVVPYAIPTPSLEENKPRFKNDFLEKQEVELESINNKVALAWKKRLDKLGYGGNDPSTSRENNNAVAWKQEKIF